LTLYDVNTDPFDIEPDCVRVQETHIGKGVFAVRRYPATAVIGEITGELFDDPGHSDEYTFEFTEEIYLNPAEPFRFLNHSCDPNCEFDLFDQDQTDDEPARSGLFLIAKRIIEPGEPLTIDYHWPLEDAIRCQCGEPNCRGWVVDRETLEASDLKHEI
jgi:hypothetical protein